MDELLELLSKEEREHIQETPMPEWMDPMLAQLTKDYFSDPGWIFERKLDGERCLAFCRGDQVQLKSRNQKNLNIQYPEVVEILEEQDVDHFIVDGEIVAFDGNITSFARLQDRMHVEDPEEARQTGISVFYYLFDLLYIDEYDITQVGLRHRKSILKRAMTFDDPLRLVAHRNEEGESFFNEACQKGWEGIIAKQADSPYLHSRSQKWLKFKCVNRQEFVIGGYTDPHGKRVGFGALLLGYYDGDDLMYAGKVGTGFDEDTLQHLGDRLSSLERENKPFADGDISSDEVHWVEPQLVAQIGFEEWTDYNKLRQPRFQGLRQDKAPEDVVREEPHHE
ncbi:MAG: non-homologous end-joining DNA ligase [Anaerolineales bacterium]